MLKNIALREQLIWYPCKIDLKSDSVEKLELLSIDEIKSSTFIRKKYINECIVYFNENNYGFFFDTSLLENRKEDVEKCRNEISRAENGVLNKIVEMKKRGRVYAK